MMLVEEK